MGGVKSEHTKQQWEALPEAKRLDTLLHWIIVEADGKRVKGIVLSKATVDKISPPDMEKLEKRGYTIYVKLPDKPLDVNDNMLYENGKSEKTVVVAVIPDDIEKQKAIIASLKMPSAYIKKSDYDSMTPEQRIKAYSGRLCYFVDTTTLVPESQAIVDTKLGEAKKLEEALANQTRILSLNDWILSLGGN